MKKIVLSTIAALALFATSASANHAMYIPGDNVYRDSGLMTCSTKEASLKVIQGITTVDYLTYGVARKITEANNCVFHRDPVNFTISELFCKLVREDTRPFTITKATIEGGEEKFTILFTDSETPACEKQI